jgi:hypothetical protein
LEVQVSQVVELLFLYRQTKQTGISTSSSIAGSVS